MNLSRRLFAVAAAGVLMPVKVRLGLPPRPLSLAARYTITCQQVCDNYRKRMGELLFPNDHTADELRYEVRLHQPWPPSPTMAALRAMADAANRQMREDIEAMAHGPFIAALGRWHVERA